MQFGFFLMHAPSMRGSGQIVYGIYSGQNTWGRTGTEGWQSTSKQLSENEGLVPKIVDAAQVNGERCYRGVHAHLVPRVTSLVS